MTHAIDPPVNNATGTTNWTVEPHPSTVEDAPARRFLHTSGRVEIAIEPYERSYYSSDTRERVQQVLYPVNVYEASMYNWTTDEWEFSDTTATVRPSTNGTGYAESYREAHALAIDAILAMETEGKWLSEPLDADVRQLQIEYASPDPREMYIDALEQDKTVVAVDPDTDEVLTVYEPTDDAFAAGDDRYDVFSTETDEYVASDTDLSEIEWCMEEELLAGHDLQVATERSSDINT